MRVHDYWLGGFQKTLEVIVNNVKDRETLLCAFFALCVNKEIFNAFMDEMEDK